VQNSFLPGERIQSSGLALGDTEAALPPRFRPMGPPRPQKEPACFDAA
jgi:hypothetical protein